MISVVEIYLDNCATTRVDEDVANAVMTLMRDDYGNPSSLHKKGIEAQLRLDAARAQTAAALGCAPSEIIFTSGGTEANNIAISGGANALRRSGNALVTTAWEHSSVLSPMRELAKNGASLTLVTPESDGHIDINNIANAVTSETILVSCMLVNSEVGTIADIAELVRLVRRKNPKTLIHCDAVQAFGKIPFSVKKLGVDLLSVSGHKIHAPKGVGALFIKSSARVLPIYFGGGQENAVRPGTQPLPAIVGFGLAAENAAKNISGNYEHVKQICKYFVNKLSSIDGLCMNSPVDSTPYICNLSLPRYRSEIMLHYLASKGVYVSSGAACSKGKTSHVLAAMNLPRERAESALRVSFSKYTSASDVDTFFDALSQGLREIRV